MFSHLPNNLTLLQLQIFEWWYFKKYGTSFIEQVSLNHISPLLGGTDTPNGEVTNSNGTTGGNGTSQTVPGMLLSFALVKVSFSMGHCINLLLNNVNGGEKTKIPWFKVSKIAK